MPNIQLRMLVQTTNAGGYKNYPENVSVEFCRHPKDP